MGKHGVLVWDRIFEGRKAKSVAELARIGNAVGHLGAWWGGREKMVGLLSKKAAGRERSVGSWRQNPGDWGGSATCRPGGSNTSLSFHAGKLPLMTKGCRGREANDEKVRCRLWHDEYVWRVVV